MALKLFHEMSARVPAYKEFLKQSGVNPKNIRTIKDFENVPPVNKDNYLRKFPRDKLCWDGDFKDNSWVISTTSGSTGQPFYFPRTNEQDMQYALTAELYLRENFNIQEKSTLYIVAFPMGAWIGGVFTYEAVRTVAERGGYNLSIITPGIHKKETINAVKQLGSSFDQIIIGAYAPFLKDILDDGIREGIDWKNYDLGFVFSAEAFSEAFRDYVIKKTGLKNAYTSSLNHYGTVDLGTMSHETPLTNLIRRTTIKDHDLYRSIFGDITKVPTLTQYIPEMFYFEQVNQNLYCSTYSGIPLVRYDLKDHGGVMTLEEIEKKLKNRGLDLKDEASRVGLKNKPWNLPLVYVYERSDLSVSFFAFQIYPEIIRRALQDSRLENDITGKFMMSVVYDKTGQQKLVINTEMKASVVKTKTLSNTIEGIITKQLLADSSEYREVHKLYGKKVYPEIILWTYEDPTYFKPGTKQKWTA